MGYKRIMAESIWLAADFFPFFSPHFAPLLLVLYTTVVGSSLAFLSSKKPFQAHHLLDGEGASNFFFSLKTDEKANWIFLQKLHPSSPLFAYDEKYRPNLFFFASKAFSILSTYFKAIFSGMMKYDVDLS